ncbi:peptide chain release factor N(5)-glutamine methyltransferase [Sneathiella glossodoripedis]|uniref:peptide chain release factor N(5)-glutamine methyltransferase n=1 Tax=Sneathiella glossodoripedis TaxID=418853 RepID=UPI000563A588|nr:peptide chain release factor N(5)-glutamine methyltransferase [Sneathiella glossodoripedis]
MRVDEAVRKATEDLSQTGIVNPRQDARILLGYIVEDREVLYRSPERTLSPHEETKFFQLIQRRKNREPVSHLIEHREFYGLPFRVTSDVLDPRADSETLVDAVLKEKASQQEAFRLLDLGTGSGCLSLSILAQRENAKAVAVDISENALEVAAENARSLELSDRIEFVKGPWFANVSGKFDVILSNPPYIPTADIEGLEPEVRIHEPSLALDGGDSGFRCYDEILDQITDYASSECYVIFEMGMGQHATLRSKMMKAGITGIEYHKDLASIVRCISGYLKT